MSVELMEQAKSGGLFGKPKEGSVSAGKIADMNSVGNLTRRLRIVEERLQNIQRKHQITEENMIKTHKELKNDLNLLSKELSTLKSQFLEFRDKLERISDELDTKANESEFLVFKKYLELWRPVNFVTQADVERIVKQTLENLNKRK